MTHKHLTHSRYYLVALLICLVGFTACAAKKNPWGDLKNGLILEYRLQEEQALSYQMNEEFTQTMEVIGQSMNIRANEDLAFSITSEGMLENTYQLLVTLNAMEVRVETPQGPMTPELNEIPGKTFHMALSTLGEESKLEEVEAIQYEISPGESQSMIFKFKALFPDLPGRPVKVGDSWTTDNIVSGPSGGSVIELKINNVHTLKGVETLDGLECAVITTEFTGTMGGSGEQNGMQMEFSSGMEGSDTWYFALEGGHLVKTVTNGTGEGKIEMAGPQNMTIPISRVFKMEVQLVK